MARNTEGVRRGRKEPLTDGYILYAVNSVNGIPDQSGKYSTQSIVGIETAERAAELKQSLFRCALYLGKGELYSMSATVIRPQGEITTFTVEFTVYSKPHARAYIAAKTGGDPTKLAYHPRRRSNG